MRYYTKFIILAVIALVSCEETELDNLPEARVVMDAILYADQPVSISISKEILFKREEDDNNFAIEGLEVTINDGSQSFVLNDDGNGVYSSDEVVDSTKTYTVEFVYNGDVIFSESNVPSKPKDYVASKTSIEVQPFTGGGPPSFSSETVDLTWSNDNLSYYIVVITNLETDPILINDSDFERPSFRTEPLVSDNHDVGAMDFKYYGQHSMVLYKVNPEYAALYEDPGDNSLTIKTPFSNVTNGLGIFTAVNSDTLYIDVHD
ncbi:MAG: DUF4249 family protein [Bacteroidota bacterium]